MSTATMPFMVQPLLPPSQIMPVMEEAILLMTRPICSTVPPFMKHSATAEPVPAAMAQPQKADMSPEWTLM